MSHKPKVPAGATSPYPLDASQAANRDEARQDLAEAAAAGLKPEQGGRSLRFAAGAAIGSAAIAGALLFYNRFRSR
ncbi:hypothetical protein [Sphingomonas sp.]|uniref:hypothetical protein n=1 Tax=Sphingomonas sp. TaxID=28214 RepID=UPI003B0064E0